MHALANVFYSVLSEYKLYPTKENALRLKKLAYDISVVTTGYEHSRWIGVALYYEGIANTTGHPGLTGVPLSKRGTPEEHKIV